MLVEPHAVGSRPDDQPAIVVGSKRRAGSQDERPLLRKLVTAAFALVLRVLFGLGVSDTHGMIRDSLVEADYDGAHN